MKVTAHRLGELYTFVRGTSATLKTSPGPFPLVVTAEFRRSSDTWQLEGPAVCIPLVSSTGHGDAALHRVHYQEDKFALANLLVALQPIDPGVCHAKYLYHLLMAKKDELLVPLMLGTANVSLKVQDIEKVEIPLPPIAEQRRIVARIEELAAQIAEARALREQAEEEAGLVLAAAERRIWPEHSLAGAKRLDEVTTYLARGRQSEQGESDHYLIKTQHVQLGRYVSTVMRLADHIALKVKEEAKVQGNDILIACSAAGCIGRVAQYRYDGRVASTDTHVAIARANKEIVDPEYLYAYLKGAQGQHQLRSRERGDWQREKISFRLAELNLNDLRQVPVPVPPMAEQLRIVEKIRELQQEVDELKHLQTETSTELAVLMTAILDRAFKGEL